MRAQELADTGRRLVGCGEGLLAMDESNPTCNRRFAGVGIPQTKDALQAAVVARHAVRKFCRPKLLAQRVAPAA